MKNEPQVTVEQEILSDESVAYNVNVDFAIEHTANDWQEGTWAGVAVFACEDELAAELLADALRKCSWMELR